MEGGAATFDTGPEWVPQSSLHELKRGRYSTISIGHCDQLGCDVVVKTYEKPTLSSKRHRMATREAIMLKYLNSSGVPYVTHLWHAHAGPDCFQLVMELCCLGNLLEALRRQGGGGLPEDKVASVLAQPLLSALGSMHALGVIHRDIKLENIFLTREGTPRLGDFDLAVFDHEAQARGPVGTIYYMAPEVLSLTGRGSSGVCGSGAVPPLPGAPPEPPRRLTAAMDVWSLGVCLFELVAGYKPYQGHSYATIAAAVLTNQRAELPAGVSPELRALIDAMLCHNPEQRPSAKELLSHPWITQHTSKGAPRSDSASSLDMADALTRQVAKQAAQSPPSGGGVGHKLLPWRTGCGSLHARVASATTPLVPTVSVPTPVLHHPALRLSSRGSVGTFGTMYDWGTTDSSVACSSPRCVLSPGGALGGSSVPSSVSSRTTLGWLSSQQSLTACAAAVRSGSGSGGGSVAPCSGTDSAGTPTHADGSTAAGDSATPLSQLQATDPAPSQQPGDSAVYATPFAQIAEQRQVLQHLGGGGTGGPSERGAAAAFASGGASSAALPSPLLPRQPLAPGVDSELQMDMPMPVCGASTSRSALISQKGPGTADEQLGEARAHDACSAEQEGARRSSGPEPSSAPRSMWGIPWLLSCLRGHAAYALRPPT